MPVDVSQLKQRIIEVLDASRVEKADFEVLR